MKRLKLFLRRFFILIVTIAPKKIGKLIYWNSFIEKRFSIDFDELFRINFPENQSFSFVQIGGNDGVSFDNLFINIQKRKSQGVILEPSNKYFDRLQINYKGLPQISLLQKAFHPTDKTVVLNEVSEEVLKNRPKHDQGIGSLKIDHLIAKGVDIEQMDRYEVECVNFKDLINDYPNLNNIDLLQSDTEGFDFEIVSSLDFSLIKPKVIKYENVFLSIKEKALLKAFLNKNRYLVFDGYTDSVAINQNIFPAFNLFKI